MGEQPVVAVLEHPDVPSLISEFVVARHTHPDPYGPYGLGGYTVLRDPQDSDKDLVFQNPPPPLADRGRQSLELAMKSWKMQESGIYSSQC